MKVVTSIIESLALKYSFKCSISHSDKELGIFHLFKDHIYIVIDIDMKDTIKVNMVTRPYKVIPVWSCTISTLEQTLKDRISLF